MSVEPATSPAPRRASPPFRLSGRGALILGAIIALVLIYATDQIVPATSSRQPVACGSRSSQCMK